MKQPLPVSIRAIMKEVPMPDYRKRKQFGILADSREVIESFYTERIASLCEILNQLNLLEHSKEIVICCSEIMKAKRMLNEVRGSGRRL